MEPTRFLHEVDAAEREAEALAAAAVCAGGAVEALARSNGALATVVTALAEFEPWVAATQEAQSAEPSMTA